MALIWTGNRPDTPEEKRLNLIGIGLFVLIHSVLLLYACLPDKEKQKQQREKERAADRKIQDYYRQNPAPPLRTTPYSSEGGPIIPSGPVSKR